AFFMFSELGVDEYKWDWEGKLVDESVMERLFSDYYDYFHDHPIGHEKFITFRLPNPKTDTEFRLGRAFMTLLSSSVLANHFKLPPEPLFEVIVPMTETSRELIAVEEAFDEIASLKHPLYRLNERTIKHIHVIPLFEDVDTIIRSDEIVQEFIDKHRQVFGSPPTYIRPYIARSDPALNSGMAATVLATKIALSRYKRLAEENGIPMYPIIGSASLPFRGGLTPYSVEAFAKEFSGIRTALLQSAFRYDYPKDDVIQAIKQLHDILPNSQPMEISAADESGLVEAIAVFEQAYRPSVEGLADTINHLATKLPRRRERVQHIGLFGYSRGVGGIKLPRAIGFTAALYSLGVPPEFIGTGRGLKKVRAMGKLSLVEKYYLNLKADLLRAGKFINHGVLAKLAATNPAWAAIAEDIKEVEAYLDVKLEPETDEERKHHELTTQIFAHMTDEGDTLTNLIESAARMRHSMG
ncbi:MAG TPA: phosphoenolpyruvate carboxylase, partial [Candidatus Saccharimonadia bacterium]